MEKAFTIFLIKQIFFGENMSFGNKKIGKFLD